MGYSEYLGILSVAVTPSLYGIAQLFQYLVDLFSRSDIGAKVQGFIQWITDIPKAIWAGLAWVAAGIAQLGYTLGKALQDFVNFVSGGLAWLWVTITTACSFAWRMITFIWNTVTSLARIIWERKLDFLAALKTSMIAYETWNRIKAKYAGDPLKMLAYSVGLELAQPLMYWLNKTLLHSLYGAMQPKCTLVTTGKAAGMVLGLAPERLEQVDFVSWWDRISYSVVTMPTVIARDSARWFDSIETYIGTGINVTDTITYSDAVELALATAGSVVVT